MKLDVPFYFSKTDSDCGPVALKMALEYFGESHSVEELKMEERALESSMVWSSGIARAARKLGFPVRLISISNFKMDDLDFYKKHANDKAKIVLAELSAEMRELGVEVEERSMALDELLGFVSKDSIPIALVNWFVISGRDGFHGHFLPITGYDEEYVYVHNPGIANAMHHMPIKRELFLSAWESKGTDKDAIIVSRK